MTLQILVDKPDLRSAGKFVTIYRNSLMYDDSVSIPINRIIDGLRLLYPSPHIVIHFALVY